MFVLSYKIRESKNNRYTYLFKTLHKTYLKPTLKKKSVKTKISQNVYS